MISHCWPQGYLVQRPFGFTNGAPGCALGSSDALWVGYSRRWASLLFPRDSAGEFNWRKHSPANRELGKKLILRSQGCHTVELNASLGYLIFLGKEFSSKHLLKHTVLRQERWRVEKMQNLPLWHYQLTGEKKHVQNSAMIEK